VTYGELPGNWMDDFRWADGTELTRQEFLDVIALRNYYHRSKSKGEYRLSQRRALNLLKGYLTADQRAQLRRDGEFRCRTVNGAVYRIDARRGKTERVTHHGSRWFAATRFCLHDDQDVPRKAMPPADLALTHLLLLMSDEEEFLRLANATEARDQLWNGAYLRRLRQARRERENILAS